MDCYFHHAVPSIARCAHCAKPICATCRGANADCPSCRLAAKVEAAAAQHGRLGGGVGPSFGAAQVQRDEPRRREVATLRPESRALCALGYPFWPLAVLALLDPQRTPAVQRHAWQALGFNAGMYGIAWLLAAIAEIPLIGLSAWPLLPFVVPVAIVASVVYGVKAWRGDEVRVPFVSDVVDARLERADRAGDRTTR